jgi:spore protease
VRPVSVIVPGVMGVTGISTAEIIKSICGEIKPDLVILIDALAARSTPRLYSTIQMTDTGLTPSAGLANDTVPRQAINRDFLGIPVISIGIPTVINAGAIIADAISMFANCHENPDSDDNALDPEMLENIHQFADAMFATSSPFVATKEIDAVIHFSAHIISTAINMALFKEDLAELSRNFHL